MSSVIQNLFNKTVKSKVTYLDNWDRKKRRISVKVQTPLQVFDTSRIKAPEAIIWKEAKYDGLSRQKAMYQAN